MGIFKDENGRSYGDWTHRDQGRTRQNANQIAGSSHTEDGRKWYEQTLWIVFFLIVFWPAGVILMWRPACLWPTAVKIAVSILLVAVIGLSYSMSQAVVTANGTLG